MTPRLQEVEAAQLLDSVDDPFLQHRLGPRTIGRAWRHGRAFAVWGHRYRYGETLTVLGPPEAASDLLEQLVEEVTFDRVLLGADVPVPSGSVLETPGPWDWMLTTHRVHEAGGVETLDAEGDVAAINELLDSDNPDAHGRPSDSHVAGWVGVRSGAGLLALGALERTEDGSGHLRSVTTRQDARGRGLGAAVSARLTNLALEGRSGVATLGVYCENHAARRIYERLGYKLERTLVAGVLHRR